MNLKKYILKIQETEITYDAQKTLESPDKAAEILYKYYAEYGEEKEKVLCVLLNAKKKVIGIDEVSVGTLTNSILHPREIFRKAIIAGADTIIIAHNHPSGDATPSKEDERISKRLVEAGEIISIPVIDSLVIGKGTYTSLKQKHVI